MTRTELIAAIAAILLAAFLAGWFVHWLVSRIGRSSGTAADLERMAAEVQEAEEVRDQAVAWQRQREQEMANQIQQTEAELAAAMDGLRSARAEIEDLRTWIEEHTGQKS